MVLNIAKKIYVYHPSVLTYSTELEAQGMLPKNAILFRQNLLFLQKISFIYNTTEFDTIAMTIGLKDNRFMALPVDV